MLIKQKSQIIPLMRNSRERIKNSQNSFIHFIITFKLDIYQEKAVKILTFAHNVRT